MNGVDSLVVRRGGCEEGECEVGGVKVGVEGVIEALGDCG